MVNVVEISVNKESAYITREKFSVDEVYDLAWGIKEKISLNSGSLNIENVVNQYVELGFQRVKETNNVIGHVGIRKDVVTILRDY